MKSKGTSTTAEKGAFSVAEFCDHYGISRALYFKLRKSGRGPAEINVGELGAKRQKHIITSEAAAEWCRRMEAETAAAAAAKAEAKAAKAAATASDTTQPATS